MNNSQIAIGCYKLNESYYRNGFFIKFGISLKRRKTERYSLYYNLINYIELENIKFYLYFTGKFVQRLNNMSSRYLLVIRNLISTRNYIVCIASLETWLVFKYPLQMYFKLQYDVVTRSIIFLQHNNNNIN